VNEILKTNKIAIAIILIAIVALAAPTSGAIYQGGQSESEKAEKMVEVAEKAGERTVRL